MKLSISLPNLVKVRKAIQQELIRKVNIILKDSLVDIKNEVVDITKKIMYKSRFFNEILHGDLKGHFGIPANNVSNVVNSIIEEIGNNVEIFFSDLRTLGSKVNGGVKIGIGKNGFASLLTLAEGYVKTERNVQLHWLDWVMTRGDQVIVSQHDIQFEPGEGRSGMAIMVKESTASWRVPADFSGTIEDNVITREILQNLEEYSKEVSRIIHKHANKNL